MIQEKILNNSKIIKCVFYVLVCITFLSIIIQVKVLPEEVDHAFETRWESIYNGELDPYRLLYKGSFVWQKPDGTEENIEFPGRFSVEQNDPFVITSRIPFDYNENAIILRSSQQIIRIYIDDELRVNYDTKNTRPFGSQTTSRYVICETSNEDAGKLLRIEIISPTSTYSGILNEVYACDKSDFWQYMYKMYSKSTLFAIVLFCVGLFTIFISIAFSLVIKQRINLEYLGWCIVLLSGWLISESKLRQALSLHNTVVSNSAFLVIMLAPIPLLVYVNEIQRNRYGSGFSKIVWLAVFNFLVSNLLQVLNLYDYIDLLPFSHIILVISFIAVFISFIADYFKKKLSEYRGIAIGLGVLMLSVLIESVLVYVVTNLSGLALTLGVLVFLATAVHKAVNDIKIRETFKNNEKLNALKISSDKVSMDMLRTLSEIFESKSDYTRGRSIRVANYTALMGRSIGLSKEEVEHLHYAVGIRDIGLIGVPDSILHKATPLTEEEREIYRSHCTVGADMVKAASTLDYAEDIVRYHHERFDGSGYPDGLKGKDIPLGARIIAVAEAFDVMNNDTATRKALKKLEIRREILINKGIKYDPEIVDLFISLFDEGVFDNIMNNTEINVVRSSNENIDSSDTNAILSKVISVIDNKNIEEGIDRLTGLSTRSAGETAISGKMNEGLGALVFIDMDNLKKINDVHGHEKGDKALKFIGNILKDAYEGCVATRIGGDEFILFLPLTDKEAIYELLKNISSQFVKKRDTDVLLKDASLSIGAYIYEEYENYEEALAKADKALYTVKHKGKGDICFFNDIDDSVKAYDAINMKQIQNMVERAGQYTGVMEVEYREFTKMYDYVSKLCERYKYTCHLSIISLSGTNGYEPTEEEIERSMDCLDTAISENVRSVDIATRYSSTQFLIIFLGAGNQNIDGINERIIGRYERLYGDDRITAEYKYVEKT